MKKKGFTLIELLAVIIILAIIALIATPIVLNVVDNTKKSAFEQTARGYYDAARYVYDEMYLNQKTQNVYFTFQDGEQTSSNEEYKLQTKGEIPKGGLVYLTKDGNVSVSIHNNKWCAIVDNEGKVSLNDDINNCGYTDIPDDCYRVENHVLYYKKNENCPTKITALIIPSEVNGQTVEQIGNSAFKGVKINLVVIPNTVTKIGLWAFEGSSLKNVVIPNSVTFIDYQAFRYNEISSIEIPSSVTEIGISAFNYNQLPDDQAFIYARNSDGTEDKATVISYGGAKRDNVHIPASVTTIGQYAFENNDLTSITIPESVTNIGHNAFHNNQLTSVVIPNSVTGIGMWAFSSNQLMSVEIPNSVTKIGMGAFNYNQLPDDQAFIYARNSDGTADTTNLISYGGAKRDNVIIPKGIEVIGEGAFANYLLASVTIPNSVISIGERAFFANRLTSVEIPNSVTFIGKEAFARNQLTSVTIPNSVTRIDMWAFEQNKLTNITIPSSVTTIGAHAFGQNNFPNASAIIIEGENPNRFDSNWTNIGFPAK